jgi:putative nucleotidyltransferase with HDIG domain
LGSAASVVNDFIAPPPARHLPQMMIATTFVAVLPLAISLALRASGLIASGWLSMALAIALSLSASSAGNRYWRKRGGGGEVLFSELLLWGWIRRWRQERELANATRLLALVNSSGTPLAAAAAEHEESLSIERREQLLRQLAGALEGQDVYLNGHSRRVARHATMIARGMGLPSEEVARIRAAAAIHDVGKLRTPKAILNKPGRLTDAEFEVIKRHPVDGAEMVAALGDAELTQIVRHHHERLDGAGYPDRLAGDEIPVGARIIAVADTFDAITSARPYRDAAPHQKAIDVLRTEAGAQLDPDAVRSFLAYYSGNRPALVWAILTSSVRRVVAWLSGDPAAAATLSASKVAAATAATAAIGAAAGVAPVLVVHHASRPAAKVHHVATWAHGVPVGLTRPAPSPLSGSVPPATPARPGRTSPPVRRRTRRGAAHSAAGSHTPHTVAGNRRRGGANAGAVTHGNISHAGAGATSTTVRARPTVRGQGAAVGTPGSRPVSKPAPPAQAAPPAHATPLGHSQVSHGNGNGHDKSHGNANANGHADASSHPAVSAANPPTGQGNANAQGDASGQGNAVGAGNANAQGSGNAQANANTVAPSVSPGAPSAGTSQSDHSQAQAAGGNAQAGSGDAHTSGGSGQGSGSQG